MKPFTLILCLAVILTGLVLLTPAPAEAQSLWCIECANSGDCIACCRCDGYTFYLCANWCEGSASQAQGPTQASCEPSQLFTSAWDLVKAENGLSAATETSESGLVERVRQMEAVETEIESAEPTPTAALR